MSTPSSTPTQFDILVLGAGPAGMAAALTAASMGHDVLLCEKSSQVGGTAATSAGTVWIPQNNQNIRAGFTSDTKEAARHYLESLLDEPAHGQSVREQFLEHGPAVIDWFENNTEVKFIPCGVYPDYLDAKGAATSGRAIIPQPFDGRLLGEHFFRVRAPISEFMIFNGMMVGKSDIPHLVNRFKSLIHFFHAGQLFLRYLIDRLHYPRGTRLMLGNALVARLYYSLLAKKASFLFQTKLDELILENDRVVGAQVISESEKIQLFARKGVIIATGGFAHNKQLRESFMTPTVPLSMAVPENMGDGIVAAQKIGAMVRPQKHGTGAFWTPVSKTGSNQWAGLYPHLALDRAKPGLIAVNGEGKRFVNEADSYHHFVLAMLKTHRSTPTAPVWLICDAAFIYKYGLGAIHPGTRKLNPFVNKKWLVVANTIKDLALAINVPGQALEATIERHNQFAATGVDLDFAKGSTQLNKYNGDPSHKPNPCIGPLVAKTYCAMAVWPAELGTSTGLETDQHGRVLNQKEMPIDGLYVCGNDMSSIMRGTYPGPGTTLGPALVFGHLAAIHAVNQK